MHRMECGNWDATYQISNISCTKRTIGAGSFIGKESIAFSMVSRSSYSIINTELAMEETLHSPRPKQHQCTPSSLGRIPDGGLYVPWIVVVAGRWTNPLVGWHRDAPRRHIGWLPIFQGYALRWGGYERAFHNHCVLSKRCHHTCRHWGLHYHVLLPWILPTASKRPHKYRGDHQVIRTSKKLLRME